MATEDTKKSIDTFKVDPNAWMVTFGDLIMLLLTFFVLLLTMKSMDSGAMKERFQEMAATTGPLEHADMRSGGSVIEGQYAMKKSLVISSNKMLEEVFDLLEGMDRKTLEEHNLEKLRKIINIEQNDRGVVVRMEFDYLFDPGLAEIRSDRYPFLDSLGRLFYNVANDIQIMGHSDNQPVQGGEFESNLELSFYRALSVMFYLTNGVGLKKDRFAAGGYGELRPRHPNDSPENRSKNRRIEFILKRHET